MLFLFMQAICKSVFSLQQLRVDLLDFTISEPDATGICSNDYLEITGGASSVPRICGENTNEHGKIVYQGELKICTCLYLS
jgi:hypothetical protein